MQRQMTRCPCRRTFPFTKRTVYGLLLLDGVASLAACVIVPSFIAMSYFVEMNVAACSVPIVVGSLAHTFGQHITAVIAMIR